MKKGKYDYLENETLQNIQILLEEKDFIIANLLEACKSAFEYLQNNKSDITEIKRWEMGNLKKVINKNKVER